MIDLGFAENNSHSQLSLQKPLTLDKATLIAHSLKLAPSSPIVKEIAERLDKNIPLVSAAPPLLERPVIRHIQGKSNFTLPSKEELQEIEERYRARDLKRYDEIQNDTKLQKEVEEIEATILKAGAESTPPKIPSCLGDKTFILRLSDNSLISKAVSRISNQMIIADYLFTKGVIPPDPDKTFGAFATVTQYSEKPGDVLSIAAAATGIPCLPYRIRLTNDYAIHYTGIDALKNYDSSPKGELHLSIAAKLKEYR
jgi:hypothetical protein